MPIRLLVNTVKKMPERYIFNTSKDQRPFFVIVFLALIKLVVLSFAVCLVWLLLVRFFVLVSPEQYGFDQEAVRWLSYYSPGEKWSIEHFSYIDNLQYTDRRYHTICFDAMHWNVRGSYGEAVINNLESSVICKSTCSIYSSNSLPLARVNRETCSDVYNLSSVIVVLYDSTVAYVSFTFDQSITGKSELYSGDLAAHFGIYDSIYSNRHINTSKIYWYDQNLVASVKSNRNIWRSPVHNLYFSSR